MIELLLAAVYSLTSLLLWPVVIALLFAIMHCLFLLGELLVEHRERRQPCRAIDAIDNIPDTMGRRHGIREWKRQHQADAGADHWLILDRTEGVLAARLDRARIWVRLGPALGLCGTLIPLGPALMALAQNDLTRLSEGLILAFGTTVLGLLAGGLAWLVMNVQQRWYRLDLAEIRAALERTESRSQRAASVA